MPYLYNAVVNTYKKVLVIFRHDLFMWFMVGIVIGLILSMIGGGGAALISVIKFWSVIFATFIFFLFAIELVKELFR